MSLLCRSHRFSGAGCGVGRRLPQLQLAEKIVAIFQFLDKVLARPVGVQQQVLGVTVQKTAVSPQLQFIGKVVDVPIVAQRQIPMVPSVQNSIEIHQLLAMVSMTFVVVDIPVVTQRRSSWSWLFRKPQRFPSFSSIW